MAGCLRGYDHRGGYSSDDDSMLDLSRDSESSVKGGNSGSEVVGVCCNEGNSKEAVDVPNSFLNFSCSTNNSKEKDSPYDTIYIDSFYRYEEEHSAKIGGDNRGFLSKLISKLTNKLGVCNSGKLR